MSNQIYSLCGNPDKNIDQHNSFIKLFISVFGKKSLGNILSLYEMLYVS